jgi:hypothetical protein
VELDGTIIRFAGFDCCIFLPAGAGLRALACRWLADGAGGGDVSSLEDSLGQVMAVQGVRAAALIDIETGMVVRSVGVEGPEFPVAAASMADEARLAAAVLGPAQPGGDLEEISLVTIEKLHVSKVLKDGLLLFVDLDRSRVNMALASLQVRQLAPAVLA